MPGIARSRSRYLYHDAGTATWNGGGLPDSTSQWYSEEFCDDTYGNWDGSNPFYLERKSNLLWRAFGTMRDTGYGWTYGGYGLTGSFSGHVNPATPEPSDTESLTTALARSNPDKPNIDLPVFIYELKDIPEIFEYYAKIGAKEFKDRPIKEVAGLYLQHEYGVKAFFRDLLKMLDFQKATEQRFRSLQNLRDRSYGLTRRSTVWEDYADGQANYFASYLTPLYQESNLVIAWRETRRRKWVSTRWAPSEDFKHLSDDDLKTLTFRIVYGLNLSFATLWEAMPWSWLIDWFTNVGDYASLHRNVTGATFGESCIMKSTETNLNGFLAPWNDYHSAVIQFNEKATCEYTRFPTGSLAPSIEFTMPFFNDTQLSILSALWAQRVRPRLR